MSAVLRISLQERSPSGDTFQLQTKRQGIESFTEFQHFLSAESPAHFDLDMLSERNHDGTSTRMIKINKENSDLTA
jgi:hypothetical protein